MLDPISIDYYYKALAQELDREVERCCLVIKAEKGCRRRAGVAPSRHESQERRRQAGSSLNLSPVDK